MYSQAAVSSASVAARAVLRWDGFSEKGVPGRPALAGTLGAPAFAVVSAGRGPRGAAVPAPVGGVDGASSRGAKQVPSEGFSPRVAASLALVHRCRLV